MWRSYDKIINKIKEKKKVKEEDLKFCMATVMIILALVSWQRTGAVQNCTVDEYYYSIYEEEENITVIKVINHKTGATSGSAKLTAGPVMAKRLDKYVKYVRPKLADKSNDTDRLFILKGSKPVLKISNLKLFLEKKTGLNIPSFTEARKIGSTMAASHCNAMENQLINSQMSHQAAVAEKYYQATKRNKRCCQGFQETR